MQNRSSDRPLHKSYTSAKFGEESALAEARAAVENALILNPQMPAHLMVEVLMESAEEDLTFRLRVILEAQFYLRTIRSQRHRQATANHAQLTLPGFPHLPVNIPGPKGAPIHLLDANTYAVREYCRLLMKAHRERKQTDPKMREAFGLLEKMRAASQTEKNITVRQVLLLEDI